jgi:hypothetical protein
MKNNMDASLRATWLSILLEYQYPRSAIEKGGTNVGTKIIRGLLTLILLMATFVPGLSAQTVEAFVDRDTIHIGETVKFTIKWSGPNQGTSVNLEALKKDFHVLGTTQSNQIKMFEGQTIITTELITKLKPKHPGKLEIPSFQVGPHQTSPIILNVLSGPQPGQPGDRGHRFL